MYKKGYMQTHDYDGHEIEHEKKKRSDKLKAR